MTAPVILLLGPTASGKSAAAAALAECLPSEIVSVDSALVYRGMDIGTAKPDHTTRARIRHHLIDICDPTEAYSAGRFVTDARRAVDAIVARGKLPVLTGGTMLYVRALLYGLAPLPAADSAVRAALDEQARCYGWPRLHAELAAVDPVTAARLHQNDAQRIQRALEVYRVSGTALSQQHNAAAAGGLQRPLLRLAVAPARRARLHERIAERFEGMLRHGLVEEVQGLRERRDIHAALPAMRAVGYRQTWAYLEGEHDYRALRERGIAATRQLARRQLNWLRREPQVYWLDTDDPRLNQLVKAQVSPMLYV